MFGCGLWEHTLWLNAAESPPRCFRLFTYIEHLTVCIRMRILKMGVRAVYEFSETEHFVIFRTVSLHIL